MVYINHYCIPVGHRLKDLQDFYRNKKIGKININLNKKKDL
jgi:hypothetical protein